MEFEHSVTCQVDRGFAWGFWANVDNWAVVDPAVEWVRLEGPFAAGTKGITKPIGMDVNEWTLSEVDEGKRAVIMIQVPGAVVSFEWVFADMPTGGTKIVQRVKLEGERAGDYAEGMKGLEQGIPAGMEKLVIGITRAADERQ